MDIIITREEIAKESPSARENNSIFDKYFNKEINIEILRNLDVTVPRFLRDLVHNPLNRFTDEEISILTDLLCNFEGYKMKKNLDNFIIALAIIKNK